MGQRRSTYDRVVEREGHKFIRLDSGRLLTFWDAMTQVERAHTALGTAISRCFKLLSSDRDVGDYDLERLEWKIDLLDSHIGAIRAEIAKRRSVQSKEERIALLRNTEGRTPEEAAEFNKKADELERRLKQGG